ncbi:glycosyltransferase [Pseudooceanicola sp.]|uniref:glycosyltransferase n=1 Tax=Pseudooceanicola sp. TaxID=1914328 RepID=UPI0035C6E3B5
MQVIGLCRFSYPAIGGFQVDHDTPEARAAFLYAPDRMEDRFRVFESFTLPSLRAQTDPEFTFLIVIGEDLPPAYRARLEAVTDDLPQVEIQAHPPGPHRDVMKRAINSLRDIRAPALQFRLDDDDALGCDFIARAKEEARARAGMLTGNRHIALDFHNGYVAAPGPDGLHAKISTVPLTTAALAVAFEPQVRLTVMNFNHTRLPRFMTVDQIDSPPMYVRGYSRWNDSRTGQSPLPDDLRPLSPQEEALFRDRFGIDCAAVRQRFSNTP